MSEARIDRLLGAALHQAIADLLPMRLDFYESYLRPRGWREDAVNLAPVTAVLSFLRHEDEGTYDAVMVRAAAYAVDWWLARQGWHVRRGRAWLPAPLRLRQAGKLAKAHFEHAYRGTKVRVRIRGRRLELEIRGSIFCSSREHVTEPLCRYYLAFVEALLADDPLPRSSEITACRALGGEHCLIAVEFTEPGA
ncbi:MAG TPA: hypothetical protein VMF13_18555 [Luteitalea sp.]|nr:hypothetical protein [Luteitalea sp.]